MSVFVLDHDDYKCRLRSVNTIGSTANMVDSPLDKSDKEGRLTINYTFSTTRVCGDSFTIGH